MGQIHQPDQEKKGKCAGEKSNQTKTTSKKTVKVVH